MGRIATSVGQIGVAEAGGGAETPLIFLHGVGSDKSVWRPQLEHFGRTRRTLAFDYPGYCESDPARVDADHDDFAEAILAALDALGIGRPHVCGLSLGGVVAIALHAAAPERIASLVIADSFAVHPEGRTIHDRSVNASMALGMRALAEQRAPLLLASTTPETVRDEVIATMAAIDPQAYRIGARAVWLADQRERVRHLRVPTLILVGSEDPVTTPALSEELAGLIPGSRLSVIAGASHLANLDKPAEFNAEIDAFLNEVEEKA